MALIKMEALSLSVIGYYSFYERAQAIYHTDSQDPV